MSQIEAQLRADEDLFSQDVWQPNEVARALWALNRLKAEPDAAFMAACLRHCFSRARQMSPAATCRVLWSIGNVQGWAPPRAWVARALAATHARIGGFKGHQLSMLATSLARLEHRPSDAWLATFAAAAAPRLPGMNVTALTNMLWSLATLGYRPDRPWLDAAWARLSAAAEQLPPQQLLQLTWALPALGWVPPTGGVWEAMLARGRGVVDTPRATLQRMRWAERAARTRGASAAASAS
jgi:hypothetical protein